MLGTQYPWLLATVRRAAAARVQLARHSLATLAVAACCLVGTLLPSAANLAPVTAVASPVVAALDQTPPEWPRTIVRLWSLLPQFLPSR